MNEPICFKLAMVLEKTKLYSIILILMTLTFTQGHSHRRQLELVQSFYCKVV